MKESGERVLPSIYLEDLYNNLKDFERMFRNYRKYSFGELNNLKDNYLTLMRADINRLSGIINENLNNNPNPILRLCKTLLINLASFVDALDSIEIRNPMESLLGEIKPAIAEIRRNLRKLSKIFPNL